MKETVLAFDIGGSYIKYGLVDEEGNIIQRDKITTPASYETLLENIRKVSENFKEKILGAAVAIPGGYDFKAGKAFAPNLMIINKKNIKEDFEDIIGKKIVVENDANLAALGEYVFSEGKRCKDMMFITLGTGVGGGIILGGKLFSKDVTVFEIGHISADINGRLCGCGRKGCLDEYCSSEGLQKFYEEISGKKDVEPREIGCLADKGNKEAIISFKNYGTLLGDALINAANLFVPQKIKIGGGLSEMASHFLPSCRESFERNIFPLYKGKISLETAGLKNDAGIMGGAALFFNL